MFLSREIDIKLCQNYTKTFICKILYKTTDHIQQIHNQSENNDIPEEPMKLKFDMIILFMRTQIIGCQVQ